MNNNAPRPLTSLLPEAHRQLAGSQPLSSESAQRLRSDTSSSEFQIPASAADDARAQVFAFEFWIAMGVLMGQRWASKHGDEPSEEWIRLLRRYSAGDPQALASGIVQRLKPNGRGEIWPPEMADVIVMLTPKPEDFGLPTVEEAYRDAAHFRWGRHPVVYETARRVGVLEVRSEARSRPAFEREFAEVCAEWMAGQRFNGPNTEPVHQLEHNLMPAWMGKYPPVAKGDFAALRRMLGPMPKPLEPEPAPAPMNDQDAAAFNQHRAELEQLAKQYRRSA